MGKKPATLFDPFCGSGTSLVEASLSEGIKEAHGFDLNPLAVLISKVKTTTLDSSDAKSVLDGLLNSEETDGIPKFKNLDFWFKPKVASQLAILKTAIDKIGSRDVKDFFLVVFSETVRNVSNTRKSEFKLYRLSEKSLRKHDPNVFAEFKKIALKNIAGLEAYANSKKKRFR